MQEGSRSRRLKAGFSLAQIQPLNIGNYFASHEFMILGQKFVLSAVLALSLCFDLAQRSRLTDSC